MYRTVGIYVRLRTLDHQRRYFRNNVDAGLFSLERSAYLDFAEYQPFASTK